jgi:hypothetical protein
MNRRLSKPLEPVLKAAVDKNNTMLIPTIDSTVL